MAGLPATAGPQAQPSDYLQAVDHYRAGQFDDALSIMRRLDEKTVAAGSDAIARSPIDLARLQAAVLLHTEVFSETAHQSHLGRADWLAARLDPRSSREFLRGWWLLLASLLQGASDLERCAKYLAQARDRIHGDAEILRASGALHEMLALAGWSAGRPSAVSGGRIVTSRQKLNIRKELDAAAGYLRQAVTVNPGLDEAQLRLGRVLHQIGDTEGAAAALERIQDRPLDRIRGYLARAFLASVEHDRGRYQRSADLYLDGLKLWPGAQSAFVGLSALLYADTQTDMSARLIERLIAAAPASDPWLAYVRGELWHLDARREQMRAAVRRNP
jgi:tetratricopeptide (TPR) repeat protein